MSRARLYKAGLKANAIVEKHLQTDYLSGKHSACVRVDICLVGEIEREFILNNAHPRVQAYRPLSASAQYNMAHKKIRDGEDVSEIADHLWRFLDKLHSENPTQYKKFIDEQMEEGRKILTPPEPVYCLLFHARAWVSALAKLCGLC